MTELALTLRETASHMQSAAEVMDLLRVGAEGMHEQTKRAATNLRAEASGLRRLADELESKRGGTGAELHG